jgi:hypothetical protein
MSPFLRFALFSAILLIGFPLALWSIAVWLPSQRGCVPDAADSFSSQRYRAYTVFTGGERYLPANREREPDTFKAATLAFIDLETAGEMHQIPAWNDLVYVRCDTDNFGRTAVVGFAEYRAAALAQLLEQVEATDNTGIAARESLARALGALNRPHIGEKIMPSEQLVRTLARYQRWQPLWIPADYAAPTRARFFTTHGLLARGDRPNQVFWVTLAP